MKPERLEQLGALTKRIVDPEAQAAIDELVAEVERLSGENLRLAEAHQAARSDGYLEGRAAVVKEANERLRRPRALVDVDG